MSRNRSGSGDVSLGLGGDGGGGGGSGGGAKVIRYTREKLLSLRGRGDEDPPECIHALEGSVVVSKVSQDPVCWDTFDADEIWASAARERRPSDRGDIKGQPPGGRMRDFDSGDEREPGPRMGPRGSIPDRGSMSDRGSLGGGVFGSRGSSSQGGGFGGRWQRGVALPEGDIRPSSRGRTPADRSERSRHDPEYEADNPDDLWDDPTSGGGGTGAAADFSAFGGSLDDEPPRPKGKTGMDAFELSDMSKAAAAFENELHGDGRRMSIGSNGGTEDKVDEPALMHKVDSSRPLASSGTTIRSGSGDDVNVFEDFGDESGGEDVASSIGDTVTDTEGEEEDLPIKSGNESNASSRLMKMIGVAGTGEAAGGLGSGGGGDPTSTSAETADANAEEPKTAEAPQVEEKPRADSTASVPSNPWGAPSSTVSSNPWGDAPSGGGMAIDSFASQQAAKDAEAAAQRQREEELLRQRQQQQAEEEEKKRWAAMQAKQAEMQAAAAAQQQAQQEQIKAQQNQVELVLIERISNILENSWGRSDLNSILSTLHANDSRVIAILSTVEALRALVARHPQRIQLGRDPTMGAEMAALRMTNLQFQEHQAQVAQAKMLQEQQVKLAEQQQAELQRRRALQEEQARQAQAQQEAMARAQAAQREEERKKQQAAAQQAPPVITDAPWYYADPQGNIQGPFGGDEMRQWLEAGYFKGDLPISQNSGGPFRSLGSYFSDASSAFQPTQPSEDKAALEAKARAEAEAQARAKAEAEAQARAEAEAAAQREKAAAEEAAAAAAAARAAAEAKAQAEAEARARAEAEALAAAQREKEVADRQEQSTQLKMMLGLGSAGGGEGMVIAGPPPPEPVQVEQQVSQPATAAKKQSKKKQQQQQPSNSVAPVQAPVPEPVPAPAPVVAWGGATAKASRKKSMSEIQQEEAREAARRAKEQGISLGSGGGGGRGAGGWANIAASGGSTAWGGAAVKVPVAAVVTPTPAVAGLGTQRPGQPGAWSKPTGTTAGGAKKQAQPAKGAASTAANKAAAVDNFGMNGRMSPTLESWCKDQMQKLNGSDDLTLVSFCMTLADKDEIRQYLTAYLGSTPQVNNFATEFIKRKGLDNGRQEETWESAGGPKGKRGKKKGGK